MKPIFRKSLLSLLLSTALYSSANAGWEEDLVYKPQPQTATAEVMNPQDPFENYNRKAFAFNMAFHNAIGEPVANAYLDYVPGPVRYGIGNFFDNLGTPISFMNSFLQGKVEEGLAGMMRFAINSTFGLLGILDIATPARLTPNKEDFGQTLYVWGVWDEASFVVVPFLGPYTTRSLFGDISDAYTDPVYTLTDNDWNRTVLSAGDAFVGYTKAAPLIDEIRQQQDPYIFMRESYLQYRTNQIYDGKAPKPKLDDFNFE